MGTCVSIKIKIYIKFYFKVIIKKVENLKEIILIERVENIKIIIYKKVKLIKNIYLNKVLINIFKSYY